MSSDHSQGRKNCVRLGVIANAAVFFVIAVATMAESQTYRVIHDFTNGGDGGSPNTGLTADAAGNLYGTAAGGAHGRGVIFKLKRSGSNWIVNPIYSFSGDDGNYPNGRVTIAADGTLYGTTFYGGGQGCSGVGCGLVYRLRPPLTAPRSALAPWNESILYRFQGLDGALPQGDLTFDSAGNIYGTTVGGGQSNWGTIYKMAPSGGGWSETVLYSAQESDGNGSQPYGGVVLDHAGNLYGVFQFGGQGNGTAYQLSPSGSGWTLHVVHNFGFDQGNGIEPIGGLIMDSAGNLFGTTLYGGTFLAGGVVYELSPAGGGWSYQTIYNFLNGDGGPEDKLTMDAAGNLYGTAFSAGAFGWGSVFKLTPSAGGWTYTSLHDFCADDFPCTDGARPVSTVTITPNGNLYGTTSTGGANGQGVIWEITP